MPLSLSIVALSLALFLTSSTWEQDAMTDAANRFVSVDDFETQALEPIEGALDQLIGLSPNPMLSASADISPIEKAFLLLDSQEVAMPRSRYLLRLNQRTFDAVTVSFVEIERYNLGPTIRDETVATYGAENTAGLEAFGIGPHVAWRFAMQPTAKTAALLLAASRRDIPTDEAAKRDCLPRRCLSLEPLDDVAPWSDGIAREVPLKAVGYPALVPSLFDPDVMEITPAYQVLELGIAAGLTETDDGKVSWLLPQRQGGENESPFLLVLIDHNLGQDTFSDAALGLAKLGLDSQEHWTRIGIAYSDSQLEEILSHAEGPLVPGN
ncbi:MAG: hypothetical protein JWQ65_2988 [Devosia sp.]|nr:hypothetical protein [Devosia sp.]